MLTIMSVAPIISVLAFSHIRTPAQQARRKLSKAARSVNITMRRTVTGGRRMKYSQSTVQASARRERGGRLPCVGAGRACWSVYLCSFAGQLAVCPTAVRALGVRAGCFCHGRRQLPARLPRYVGAHRHAAKPAHNPRRALSGIALRRAAAASAASALVPQHSSFKLSDTFI